MPRVRSAASRPARSQECCSPLAEPGGEIQVTRDSFLQQLLHTLHFCQELISVRMDWVSFRALFERCSSVLRCLGLQGSPRASVTAIVGRSPGSSVPAASSDVAPFRCLGSLVCRTA
jgi:hypothetical protein